MSFASHYSRAILTTCLIVSTSVFATDVVVTGLFKDKAMVSIDGGKTRVLSSGQTWQKVKLISADSNAATFDIDGKRQKLAMGQSISTDFSGGEKPTLKLTADGGGHFSTIGSINGYPIRFLVDTGATLIAINSTEADRMGLKYKDGERGMASTANGVVPVYKVVLNNVKIGGISLNLVEASVVEGAGLQGALLGMSFLSRLEMRREGTVMTLVKTY